MAISLDAGADKLARSGSYITTTAAFTIMGWAKQGATTPSGSTGRTYYNYGDPAAVNPYIYIGSPIDSDDFLIEVYDGVDYTDSDPYTPIADEYFHWALRYDGDSTLDLIINGSLFATLPIDISVITFTTKNELVGNGGWSDFIFANIGVFNFALTNHQIIVQSHTPFPRWFTTKSWTTLSGWTNSLTLDDSSGFSHNWTLTGSISKEISPTIPSPFPFDTQFEDSFDSWSKVSWWGSTNSPSAFLKPTQGCAYQNLYTSACTQSLVELFLASPPDFPASPTISTIVVPDLSVRAVGAAFSTIGNVPDITTSIDASLAPGVDLFTIGIAQGTLAEGVGFVAMLVLQSGGMLSLCLCTNPSGYTNFSSSTGAFPLDGLARGLQVSLSFTSGTDVAFSVLVDNVVAITGSFANLDPDLTAGVDGTYGVNFMVLRNFREVMTTGYFMAFDRLRVVADSSIVSWSGCSTATQLVAAATFCALPEREIPTPTTTTYPTVRERIFALPFSTNLMLFLERIEFLIQAGEGLVTGQGSDPVVAVWFSKDGGKTYGNGYTIYPGKMGEYTKRAYINRLGKARNWVCKIRVSDPVFWAFLDCYVDMSEGTS